MLCQIRSDLLFIFISLPILWYTVHYYRLLPNLRTRTRIRFPQKKQTVRAIGTPRERGYANSVSASRWIRGRQGSSADGTFYNYTSHSRGAMPAVLAPADSPSEEQFTLGNVAAELELEPRRANLLGAFDDAADGPADEADGQDEPADAADGAAA